MARQGKEDGARSRGAVASMGRDGRRSRREGMWRNINRVIVALVLAFAMLGWGVVAAHAQETPGTGTGAVAGDSTSETPNADTTAEAERRGMVNPRHMWQQGAADEADEAGNGAQAQSNDNGESTISPRAAAPYWGASSTGKLFYEGNGNIYIRNASKVIDVSEFQGDIDWGKVAASDVDAVILRAGWGDGGLDQKFVRNLAGVRQHHIPFGIYWYSYAYDAGFATQEANSLVNVLRSNGVRASELALPVYLDLEQFTPWSGHYPPSNAGAYEGIMNAFLGTLNNAGFTKNSIYSYVSYLQGPLNSGAIWNHVSWVAVYGPSSPQAWGVSVAGRTMDWQYTSTAWTDGVPGEVDMSAFNHVGPVPQPIGAFADVYASTPHAKEILWLYDQNIADGYKDVDGSLIYGGMRTVVRQDMAAFLYRLAGKPEFDEAKAAASVHFADVNPSTPHYKEILWLTSTGIAQGYTGADDVVTFGGMRTVVRQDMAAFLHRFALWAKINSAPGAAKSFSDVNGSTPHADDIAWLSGTGVTGGYDDGTFGGMREVVRQDMAAFLWRMNAYVLKWYKS